MQDVEPAVKQIAIAFALVLLAAQSLIVHWPLLWRKAMQRSPRTPATSFRPQTRSQMKTCSLILVTQLFMRRRRLPTQSLIGSRRWYRREIKRPCLRAFRFGNFRLASPSLNFLSFGRFFSSKFGKLLIGDCF